MTIASFITLENSPYFNKIYNDKVKSIEIRISDLKSHINNKPEIKFYKYGTNENRLIDFEEELQKLRDNIYSGFLCTRSEAKEAYLVYKDNSLSKYYIMSKLYCSYGEMKYHLNDLFNSFEEEEKVKEKIIKQVGSYNYALLGNIKLLEDKSRSFRLFFEDDEYINIEYLFEVLSYDLEVLQILQNNLSEFRYKKLEDESFQRRKRKKNEIQV